MSRSISEAIQKQVAERANGICEYCHSPSMFSPSSFQVDHIIPVSQGGGDEPSNLAFACGGCNGYKHTKTHHFDPVTMSNVKLFNPRAERWNDHFVWDDNGFNIIGITGTGRATLHLLRLNRTTNINLRKLMVLAGLKPQ